MSISDATKEKLKKWSEQLGRPYEELEKLFIAKLEAATVQLKDQNLSVSRIEQHVRKQIANEIRPGRSRASSYEGVVLGYGPLRDWNAGMFREAAEAFAQDPMSAAGMGVTDDKGTPLVTVEIKEQKGQYFRQDVGEVLKHEWERHLLAVGRPVIKSEEGDETLRIFHIRLNGEPSMFGPNFPAPKIGLISRWRCNVQEVDKDQNWVRANGATVTVFEPAEIQGSTQLLTGVLDAKKCVSLLGQVTSDFRASITGDSESESISIKEWIAAHGNKKGFFCVIEGELLQMFESGFRLGDADQLDLTDIPSVLIGLDPKFPDQMFYGEDSTVIVACEPYLRTVRERGDDNVWRTVLDDNGKPKQEVAANGLAVFPIVAMPKTVAKPVVAPPEEKPEEPKAEEGTADITL